MEQEMEARQVIAAQLRAMAATGYKVGVLEGRRMRIVIGGPDEVARRSGWLQARNARGAHIYVRPAGSVGLLLVDDLTAKMVARMREDGAAPAVVVETSPHNYQVWIRVADGQLDPPVATAVARLLAARYRGDRASAQWRHFGRLAGVTNPKPKHRRADGTFPVVRLAWAGGERAVAGDALVAEARALLMARPPAPRLHVDLGELTRRAPGEAVSPLGQMYRREVVRLVARYPERDQSRLDWMIVLGLARAYTDLSAAELGRAMLEGSPRLGERKAGHVMDYIARTVSKALATVAAERERRGR